MGYQPRRSTLDALLAGPPSKTSGNALRDWARDVQAALARGDQLIGLIAPEDVQGIREALTRAAQFGVGEAWLELASWLATPTVGEPDLIGAEAAVQNAIRLGVKGAPLHLVKLRWFYRRDDVSSGERREAYDLLRDLLRENERDAEALYFLGLLTFQGFGTEADPKAAFKLQKRAAELGNSDAWFELYVLYARGDGVRKNERAAFDANARAAEAGHHRALYNLGAFHASGHLVEKDLAKAAEWYERAYDAGNARAALTLAMMYATGEGVEQDLDYARELFDQCDFMGLDVDEIRRSVGL